MVYASAQEVELAEVHEGSCCMQDILRVLYPHALDKELAEMLTVVTRRKQVKGQDNVEQQMAELKEVFAVYDDSGTGHLEQAQFVEAIMSAGHILHLLE